jgi:hypothetical protein
LIESDGYGAFVSFLFLFVHIFGDYFLFSQKILIPVNQSFLEILFKLNIALISILFVVIVHDGIIFLSELKLLEVLFNNFLVFFCELFESLGIVNFENEKALYHLS